MLLGDLLSLAQLQAPVKVIVFKNDALAFVELEMKAAGILDFGTDLRNPNFAKMAEAAGLLGLTAEPPGQVRPMLAQAWRACSGRSSRPPTRIVFASNDHP